MTTFKYSDNAATRYNESFVADTIDVFRAFEAEFKRLDASGPRNAELRAVEKNMLAAQYFAQKAAANEALEDSEVAWVLKTWKQLAQAGVIQAK